MFSICDFGLTPGQIVVYSAFALFALCFMAIPIAFVFSVAHRILFARRFRRQEELRAMLLARRADVTRHRRELELKEAHALAVEKAYADFKLRHIAALRQAVLDSTQARSQELALRVKATELRNEQLRLRLQVKALDSVSSSN